MYKGHISECGAVSRNTLRVPQGHFHARLRMVWPNVNTTDGKHSPKLVTCPETPLLVLVLRLVNTQSWH